jgi:hypothetical protein
MSKARTYTVWVRQANHDGTTHVSSHNARSPAGAARQALSETRSDWGGEYKINELYVLGIAEGNVSLIEWND